MKRVAVALAIFAFTFAVFAAAQNYYYTNFPGTASAISEGGNWINGGPSPGVGLVWGNVATTTNLAYGTTFTGSCGFMTGDCNDSIAVLTGTWTADQSACGTPSLSGISNRDNAAREVEIHVRQTITANNSTGYEINYGLGVSTTAGFLYAGVVRWNGALNNFTGLTNTTIAGALTPLQTGDAFCASAIGSLITGWVVRSGATVYAFTATDSTYTNGSPGMGFFNAFSAADAATYGFSDFKATNLTARTAAQADVQAIINGGLHVVVDGESVGIPPGSATWSGGVTAPTNVGIQIIGSGIPTSSPGVMGAGTPTTTITGGGFAISPHFGNSTSRLSLINFQPPGLPLTAFGTCTASGCPNVRVDNLIIPSSWAGVNSDNNTLIFNNMFGVVDHNTVGDSTPRSTYVLLANIGYGQWQGAGDFGDNSWAQPDTFGTLQQMYLENNQILGSGVGTDTDVPCCSAPGTNFGGGRYTCRFNNFNPVNPISGACPNHGTDTTGRPRGARHLEAYYNTGTTAANNTLWGARSAVGIIFGNNFTGSAGSLKSYVDVDAQRRWRPDVYGSCDGSSSFDTNSGVQYYPASGSASMSGVTFNSGNASYTFTDASNPGWAVNQWLLYGTPYSIHDLNQSGGAGAEIIGNTSNTITVTVPGAPSGGITPTNGDSYTITRATVCLDQPGRGQGALLSGSSTAPTGGPANQVLDPWYEAADTSVASAAIGSNTASLIANRDWYVEAPNQTAQTSGTFPFTGTANTTASSSWSALGSHLTVNVASIAGFAINGYVNFVGLPLGTVHADNANGPYQIFSFGTGSQIVTTTGVNGGGTDNAGAGGDAITVGAGHGTLANRPTTCSVGVGYLATGAGTGAWNTSGNGATGQLYTCTATNTWTLSYTPYTYPHPLVTGVQASPSPGVSFSPLSLNFGTVIVGQTSSPQTITITNTGTANLVFGPTGTSSPAGASFNPVAGGNCPISGTLTPGSNCTQNVQVTANIAGGPYSGTFNFPSNAPGSPQTVPLSVTATSPSITFSPASLVFGTLPLYVTSSPMQATVKNTGTVSITISSVTASGVFAMAAPTVAPDCRTIGTLGAGTSCNFAVMATPAVAGLVSGSIIFTDTASGSPQSFPVSVTGLAVAPAPVPSFAMAVNLAGCKPASPPATTFCFTEDGHIYLSTCAATCSPFQPFGLTVSGTAQ